MRAKDLSGCHLLECLQKEAGKGPGAETESSFGGEEGNKQTVLVQRSEGWIVRAMLLQRLGKPTPKRQAQPGYSKQC